PFITDSGRVRVAVRVRPKTTEEHDLDFTDCVELQPEVRHLITLCISVEDIFYKLYRGIMQLKSILFMTHEFCYLFHYIGPYSF
ncbi:hypothetical protein BHE74_00010900, partial [Ensete ventricosum]